MKIHLTHSLDPLVEGMIERGICGAVVPHAKPVFMWDDGCEGGEMLAAIERLSSVCRKCVREKLPSDGYVYGIVNPQEVRDGNVSS